MYKMAEKNFLLQTLLLPLVLLSGQVYGGTRQLALTPDAPASRLLGNSTDRTWNVTGPPSSRLHLNCTDLTLLKSANCSLFIFENGEEEKTEPSTSGGHVSCYISLMKGSPLTDSGDYMDDNAQHDTKTPDPYGGTNKKRIIEGQETSRNQYPFMAVVQTPQERIAVRCGGTILTQRHILTAAHCVYGYLIDAIRVTVGVHNLQTDLDTAQKRPIEEIYIHRRYIYGRVQHDIAVLTLKSNLVLGYAVQLVHLSPSPFDLQNAFVIALGWGERSGASAPRNFQSAILKSVSLHVHNRESCYYCIVGDLMVNNPNPICFKGTGPAACPVESFLLLSLAIFSFLMLRLSSSR